ncbi:dihydropteroate synthase [Bacillus sp. FJAT-27916]|uniref:dihydropteroate synthase n=1 Tax=Bacillaceae TaxID=186817 RepID=UPI000670D72D|nr:dihydropteroate synthase [Bacillus sp. FJAT-27916]KMY46139.1 dihydropteroate synthase [Bacillus sp. FJAT-27916]
MVNVIECGPYKLEMSGRTLIMGILNMTPDSFSDGGRYNAVDTALERARQLIQDGADIIDVGGESTRPGYEQISSEEEIERVVPIIECLAQEVNVPISIDTYKADVARAALKAGAHIINDIWGAKADPDMAKVAADTGVPIILMHNREAKPYQDFMRDALNDLYESIQLVKGAGVKDEQIILDPGIGFAKTLEENLLMMRNLRIITSLGYPVLLGTSRKSMIGHTLQLPVEERVEGTIASVCLGIQQGCSIMRVHDVKENARAARMMDAMLGKVKVNG